MAVVVSFVIVAPEPVGSAQVAALTNTLAALTLAGVLVTNTSVEEVVQSLRKVVTVTTASIGVEFEFTLRPRNCRPRIVERKEDRAMFKVSFQEHLPVAQRTVQLETIPLSVHTRTVTLTPVPQN